MAQFKVNWHLSGLTKGKSHEAGDVVSLEPEAAQGLVTCGVLTPIEEAAEGAGTIDPSNLGKLSKAQIASYAKAELNLDLDPDKLTKDAMLAEIAARRG